MRQSGASAWARSAAARFKLLDEPQVHRGLRAGKHVPRIHRGFSLGGSREAFLARRFLLPGGRDEAHAAHPLDGLQHVHRAPDRPPAISRRLHEGEAAPPRRAVEGGRVADELPCGDLEVEEPEPVLHAKKRYEMAVPGMLAAAGAEVAAK